MEKSPYVMDRTLPRKLDVIVPEAKHYTELLDFERKLDATIVRKRQDIVEALSKPLKMKKTLRVFVSNTTANQHRATENGGDSMEKNASDEAPKTPTWTLRVHGRLLDDEPPKLENPPKFSHFIKSIKVDLDRDLELYPDGNSIEWLKVPANAAFDTFDVTRKGDVDTKAKISLYLDEQPEKYSLSPELQHLLDISVDTKSNIIMALWQYIKLHKLQDPDDKKFVTWDQPLQKIFNSYRVLFTAIPDVLINHLAPAPPAVIEYVIKVDGNAGKSPEVFDIEVDVEDPIKALMSKIVQGGDPNLRREIADLDEQIFKLINEIGQSKFKRDFTSAFAKDPVNFINRWIASQSRDLETILGDSKINVEEIRHSSFYQEPWVRDAMFHYLQR